jgi:hypothetical protein
MGGFEQTCHEKNFRQFGPDIAFIKNALWRPILEQIFQ